MRMRMGAPYLTRNICVEYDEDRRIAWRHFARHIWRYDLEPVDGDEYRTRVIETFDYQPAPAAAVYERIRIPARNRRAIEVTLQRLKVLIEGRSRLA
jgi:hypothetical protein